MTIRLRVEVKGDLTQTKRTARRLVKEAPANVAKHLAEDLRRGDGMPGAFPNPARPDSRTGIPVRTGLLRRSFRSTHDGFVTNEQGYSQRLEEQGKWRGAVRRYIEKRILEYAEAWRDQVLSKAR